MKITTVLFILLLFIGCTSSDREGESERLEKLTTGKWMVEERSENGTDFKYGVLFSSNKQFFDLDSQGMTIPTHREKIYALSGDTLTLVDYRYEPKFIEKKGTKIFLIQDLSKDRMVLKSIYPDSVNYYIFDNSNF